MLTQRQLQKEAAQDVITDKEDLDYAGIRG